MLKTKNLKNLGFTFYETLAVIAIIGIIASVVAPMAIQTKKIYNQKIFEEKCLIYEKSLVDTLTYFQFGRKGRTELTKDTTIIIPFLGMQNTSNNMFVDMLDRKLVEYFAYETLLNSNFDYSSYRVYYSPANIDAKYTWYPSIFKIVLNDGVSIVYNLSVYSGSGLSRQMAYINEVEISWKDCKYTFEV